MKWESAFCASREGLRGAFCPSRRALAGCVLCVPGGVAGCSPRLPCLPRAGPRESSRRGESARDGVARKLRAQVTGRRSPAMFIQLTPLECTLTRNAPTTPLESTLTKLLDLKPFRFNSYEKSRGEGGLLVARVGLNGYFSPRGRIQGSGSEEVSCRPRLRPQTNGVGRNTL